jgi:hypothetical protein
VKKGRREEEVFSVQVSGRKEEAAGQQLPEVGEQRSEEVFSFLKPET